MGEVANLETIMSLIIHGGDAKSKAVEAIRAAKKGNLNEADHLVAEANHALGLAHKSQTSLLADEAAGKSSSLSLLMVHGQDHLMNAITFLDMARELIDLYRRLNE